MQSIEIIGFNQGSPRYLAPGGGANSENFKNSRGEGKLIGFNGQFLAKFTKFCLKFFFNKNHKFLKIFAEILLKSQRGGRKEIFLRNISEFSPKNFFWSPL
jgi:hypothetical protein